jgi:hypothetical protein
MQMQKHVNTLAILHIIYSSLGLLVGIMVFVILAGIGLAVDQIPQSNDVQVSVSSILGAIGFLIAVILIVFSLPGIIGGIGLLKYREWARILVLIVGFFDLLHIPFGTALGIYTIWVLFNDEAMKLFGQAPTAPPPATSQ